MVLAAALIFSCAASPACALANGQQEQAVQGTISGIDWAGSTVTIRWLQSEGVMRYDELTISVPDSSLIKKNGSSIGLTYLQLGDQVKARYVNTSPGPLKLVELEVMGPSEMR
jgi:hypothetical protein